MNNLFSNKSKAWDSIGSNFFELGHVEIRTNKQLIEDLFKDILPQNKCCIIGASTLRLIEEGIEKGLNITVLDFSRKMCEDLERHLAGLKKSCDIKLYDITDPNLISKITEKYDYILADQIINCFGENEITVFFRNISNMLIPGGELRLLIKMGLYDIDKQLVEKGKALGTVDNFFSSSPFSINYSKATNELRAVFDNTSLCKNEIIDYYANKGIEVRFNASDFNESIINSYIRGGNFKFLELTNVIGTESTVFCIMQWLEYI